MLLLLLPCIILSNSSDLWWRAFQNTAFHMVYFFKSFLRDDLFLFLAFWDFFFILSFFGLSAMSEGACACDLRACVRAGGRADGAAVCVY